MRNDYIHDLTQRYPAGFYEPEENGYESLGYEPTYEEILEDGEYETDENNNLSIGDVFKDYEFDGGITVYTISKFNKDRTKVFLTEIWYNIDGSGKRHPSWHKIERDENGEKIQVGTDRWIRKG